MSYPQRFDFIYRRACEFIIVQKIISLPVNPFRIIKNNGWGLVTYRRLAELSGQRCESIPQLFKSNDGFTICNGRNFCIAYNSDIVSFNRVIFTLLHEIGHIWLGHFSNPSCNNLKTGSDKVLEYESNVFASCVMAPSVVIARCGLNDAASLKSACGLSREAADRRIIQFQSWVPAPCDSAVSRMLDEYIKLNVKRRTGYQKIEISFEDGCLKV